MFHWGRVGSMGKIIDDNGSVENEDDLYTFKEFFVSSYDNLTDKFGFKHEKKLDSISDAKLTKCKGK